MNSANSDFVFDPVMHMEKQLQNISAIYPRSPIINLSRNESFNDISELKPMQSFNKPDLSPY